MNRLKGLGKNGLLVSISATIGSIATIIAGSNFTITWGQEKFIKPVVEKKIIDVSKACDIKINEIKLDLEKHKTDINKCIVDQRTVNEKILEKLNELSMITVELKTELRMITKNR